MIIFRSLFYFIFILFIVCSKIALKVWNTRQMRNRAFRWDSAACRLHAACAFRRMKIGLQSTFCCLLTESMNCSSPRFTDDTFSRWVQTLIELLLNYLFSGRAHYSWFMKSVAKHKVDINEWNLLLVHQHYASEGFFSARPFPAEFSETTSWRRNW